jgi:hypothetical protein
VACADRSPIRSEKDRRAVYEVVRAHLLGLSVDPPELAGGGAAAPPALSSSAAEGEAADGSILRSLSQGWKFGGL